MAAKLSVPAGNRVAAIKEISRTIWRDELMPAHFDNCLFHVESGSRESGRRIVVHEFPKKDVPWAEDMGRSAVQFGVRGYCIVYPRDVEGEPLYSRDYRVARNLLQDRLDRGGAGTLQLPTFRPMRVVCQHYRMQEEQKLGGYCTFDMQFVELGQKPFRPAEDTEENMIAHSKKLQQRVLERLARPHTPSEALPLLRFGPGRPAAQRLTYRK
jgi:prophage DNA circulation protein